MTGASYVGLTKPDERSDAYTSLMNVMNKYLPENKQIGYSHEGLSRQDLKDAMMTYFYFSTAQPEKVFGKGSVELATFHRAVEEIAPGACEGMKDMGNAITEGKTRYEWTLPDGFNVVTKVMTQVSKRITIDEIPTASGKASTYSHMYEEERWDDSYRAVPANVVHSIDSYVVREMARRANHNKDDLLKVYATIRDCKVTDTRDIMSLRTVTQLINGEKTYDDYTDNQLGRLAQVIESVLDNPVFPVSTVHDAFKTYPQFCNEMRFYYKEILAEIAESNLMEQILSSLYGTKGKYTKQKGHEELPALIRNSQYGIC